MGSNQGKTPPANPTALTSPQGRAVRQTVPGTSSKSQHNVNKSSGSGYKGTAQAKVPK